MRVAILDYRSGNLRSAQKAFERAARERDLQAEIRVTDEPAWIARADRIVLPGVGAFADCRNGIDAVDGLGEALREAVEVRSRPFLGICVGMQLMATTGREHRVSPGFGWIPGNVVRLEPADPDLKIPHMGWNTLSVVNPHSLLSGITTGETGLHAYFVHSYHLSANERSDIVAQTDYGGAVTAMVARDNVVGTQFHPEKSQRLGLALIGNFLEWRP